MSSWFGSSSQAEKNADDIELDNRGENSLIDEQEEEMAQAEKLLPDMTDEEIEAMKVEKAKKARRQQLDIILSSETSLGATLTALKKSLMHYEKEKMDLNAKRQKYRLVMANYKGPSDDAKLAAIRKILHDDLPALIDEADERIITGHGQVASLERQLNNLREQRLKAERAYKRLFEPLEHDVEGGGLVYDSDDSEEAARNVTIEDVLRRYDPSSLPTQSENPDRYDTSSEDEDESSMALKDVKISSSSNSVPPTSLSASSSNQRASSSITQSHSTDTMEIPLD